MYHFFPHYRVPIVEALARSTRADYTFFGDDHDFLLDVKPAQFSDKVRFVLTRTRKLPGRYMWQWGAVRIAWNPKFDTIIFHPGPHWPCTWIGAILARVMGKRVIFWGHGYLARPTGRVGLLRRALNSLPHVHMFYGRWARQFAIETGWDPSKLHVIGNSLDLAAQVKQRATVTPDELQKLRGEWFKRPELPVAFCSARIHQNKRLDMLVDALAILRREGVEANLLLVGDGPARADLESRAKAAGIDAHFAGACYDEAKIARYVSASDLTVSPGFLGLTAMQSMAFGVPVITHSTMAKQVPEVEAIIEGRTGDLFRMGDVVDLARVMKPWLTGQHDREATRHACQDVVERFWSPEFQFGSIDRAVLGESADDLWFFRGSHPGAMARRPWRRGEG